MLGLRRGYGNALSSPEGEDLLAELWLSLLLENLYARQSAC